MQFTINDRSAVYGWYNSYFEIQFQVQKLANYNLQPQYMSGSHWVATYVKDNVINYFDSFGILPFQEMVNHAKNST